MYSILETYELVKFPNRSCLTSMSYSHLSERGHISASNTFKALPIMMRLCMLSRSIRDVVIRSNSPHTIICSETPLFVKSTVKLC